MQLLYIKPNPHRSTCLNLVNSMQTWIMLCFPSIMQSEHFNIESSNHISYSYIHLPSICLPTFYSWYEHINCNEFMWMFCYIQKCALKPLGKHCINGEKLIVIWKTFFFYFRENSKHITVTTSRNIATSMLFRLVIEKVFHFFRRWKEF